MRIIVSRKEIESNIEGGCAMITNSTTMKKFRYVLTVCCLTGLLTACSDAPAGSSIDETNTNGITTEINTPSTEIPETPTVEVTPTPVGTGAPLTGLPTELSLTARPVMVMVENSPKARPQTGLDQADIIYEVLAEGEITRFLTIFHSKAPEVIGPVRSIRPYFVEIGEELDAVMVHAGWSQEAMNLLAGHKLDHFDEVYGDTAYYWRDKSRKMPHNLYTSMEKIRQGIQNKKKREEWTGVSLKYYTTAAAGPTGSAALEVSIPYIAGYDVSYTYDNTTKQYKRFMEGKPHIDRVTEQQLTASNILIIETEHRILDKVGRRNVDVFGPGKGYLVQAGVVRNVTWENKDGLIRAFIDSVEAELLPGQTWVQIVPNGSKVTFN